MARWVVEVAEAAERELRALPADLQADFLQVTRTLEEVGPQTVGTPVVRHLEGKLWEMRLRGRSGIARAVYFAAIGRQLVVVPFFVKKTQATPRREIELALRRMAEVGP